MTTNEVLLPTEKSVSKKKKKRVDHSAFSIFTSNMESVAHCLDLYEGLQRIGKKEKNKWILRAAVVFAVSCLDRYFHDLIKYSIAENARSTSKLKNEILNIQVPIAHLFEFSQAKRKGNVIRNMVCDYYSDKPIQKRDAVLNALKIVGVEQVWNKIEADNKKREKYLKEYSDIISRRNKIAHEGDRSGNRNSKALNAIDLDYVRYVREFINGLVNKIEGIMV